MNFLLVKVLSWWWCNMYIYNDYLQISFDLKRRAINARFGIMIVFSPSFFFIGHWNDILCTSRRAYVLGFLSEFLIILFAFFFLSLFFLPMASIKAAVKSFQLMMLVETSKMPLVRKLLLRSFPHGLLFRVAGLLSGFAERVLGPWKKFIVWFTGASMSLEHSVRSSSRRSAISLSIPNQSTPGNWCLVIAWELGLLW